ncbi:hypothetical protein GCM10020220_036340 [Nonomuraea rubra]
MPGSFAVHDIGADLDDAAAAPFPHAGQDRLDEQGRALDEERELVEVRLPGEVLDPGGRLRACRVGHQHPDRAEAAGDGGDQALDGGLVRDVGGERLGDAARRTDGAGHLLGSGPVGAVVDGHGQAVGGQPAGDGGPEAPRCAGDERDSCHGARL